LYLITANFGVRLIERIRDDAVQSEEKCNEFHEMVDIHLSAQKASQAALENFRIELRENGEKAQEVDQAAKCVLRCRPARLRIAKSLISERRFSFQSERASRMENRFFVRNRCGREG